MQILNEILGFILKQRLEKIDGFKKNPVEIQNETFSSLIERAKFTTFGQYHQFHHIKTHKEFSELVPVQSYEDFYPWIERTLKGERNITWPSKISWFSKSSGTTNARSKFIPVSEASLEESHFSGGKDLLALFIQNREGTKLFEGKSISIGGSLQPNPFYPSTVIGDISAVITKNLPSWAEYFRLPPPNIALLENWDEKLKAIIKTTEDEDVRSILGVPTWTVVLLENLMKKHKLKNILELWPNFECFFHGGVAFGPYRKLFKEKFFPHSSISYLETYNASEGFFGIQDDFSLPDELLLMLNYGIFYEFISMDDWDYPFPKSLTIRDVELNKTYAMVITTSGGLWRYKIGDTVKFTSLQPARIKITGRTKQFINAFGEELMVENADAAIAFAAEKTGAIVKEYTAAPIFMEDQHKGSHEWVIAFEKIPDNKTLFAQYLDQHLCELNSDYEAKRKMDIALQKPKVHFVKPDFFYRWLEKKGKLGAQNKVPRLANSREYIQEMLQINGQI